MEIGYLTEVIFQIIGVRTDHPTVRTGTIYYPYGKKSYQIPTTHHSQKLVLEQLKSCMWKAKFLSVFITSE